MKKFLAALTLALCISGPAAALPGPGSCGPWWDVMGWMQRDTAVMVQEGEADKYSEDGVFLERRYHTTWVDSTSWAWVEARDVENSYYDGKNHIPATIVFACFTAAGDVSAPTLKGIWEVPK